jgi:hypothetical protein
LCTQTVKDGVEVPRGREPTEEQMFWKPSLTLLRIDRAALDVKWSPDGTKFAVASGAKSVPVCHYEADQDWWVSKMIKKHKSTVLAIAWHPNSQLLATGACDFKCRVFSAHIDAVDSGAAQKTGPFANVSRPLTHQRHPHRRKNLIPRAWRMLTWGAGGGVR